MGKVTRVLTSTTTTLAEAFTGLIKEGLTTDFRLSPGHQCVLEALPTGACSSSLPLGRVFFCWDRYRFPLIGGVTDPIEL